MYSICVYTLYVNNKKFGSLHKVLNMSFFQLIFDFRNFCELLSIYDSLRKVELILKIIKIIKIISEMKLCHWWISRFKSSPDIELSR